MKHLIYTILSFSFIFASCSSETGKENKTAVGYKSIHLMQSLDEIRSQMQEMEEAPASVSSKRGEGFTEYKLMKESSFTIEGMKFNPSIFMVFNPENKLVSFRLFYLCAERKEDFDVEKAIKLLDNNQVKGLEDVYQSKDNKIQIGNDILKTIEVDLESTGNPVIEYQVKYLP